jgi:hypothetical protein
VPEHLAEVRSRKLDLIAKTEVAVKDRLTKEISYWDHRAETLKLQEQAGKPNARLNSGEARKRADALEARLQKRMEELSLERQISASPPVILGGLLVVPMGLLAVMTGRPEATSSSSVDTQAAAAQARASGGQRRAAGLAFLVAVHLSRPWCNWRSLLLDDPVQHIDDYRALNLVEVLAAIRRAGRQVIVSVEDLALANVLCGRLRSASGDIGRIYDLHTSKSGTAEIHSRHDIYPMPQLVLRAAQAS